MAHLKWANTDKDMFNELFSFIKKQIGNLLMIIVRSAAVPIMFRVQVVWNTEMASMFNFVVKSERSFATSGSYVYMVETKLSSFRDDQWRTIRTETASGPWRRCI